MARREQFTIRCAVSGRILGRTWYREVAEQPHYSAEHAPAKAARPAENKMVEPVEDKAPMATDAAWTLAREHGIDMAAVAGSGQDGRITKADVAALVATEEEE